MIFRRLYRNSLCHLLALTLFFCGGTVRAQNVVLHLRNGDRVTGLVVAETTNQVTLSNTWSKEVIVLQSQIKEREILSSPAALVTTNTTVKMSTNFISMVIVPEPPRTNVFSTNVMIWLKRWKGEAAVGMDLERGATDHQLYYGRAKLTYAQPYESDPKELFCNIFNYDMAYGKTDGTLSDNRIGGSSKTDFDLSRRYYVYNLGAVSRDEIRLIDLHYEEGPGMGYHWFTQTNFLVNLELGANYQVEYRLDNSNTDSVYYRFGQDLAWKINKQMSLTEKFEYFPRADEPSQWRMRFESNLSYALILNFSLNFTVIDLYDTAPALTVPNNDFQLRTSLGVKF